MSKKLVFIVIPLLFAINTGCAPSVLPPEPTRPTYERIMELAKIDHPIEEIVIPFDLYTFPRFALPRTSIRLTCSLPTVSNGRYRFGIEGITATEGSVDRREVSLVFQMPCGETLQAFCILASREPGGLPKIQSKTLTIESTGDCR